MAEWTDEELLGYVDTHSRTERALFHRDHILRLYKLARVAPPPLPGDWYSMFLDVAGPLLKRARDRIRLKLV